MSNTGFKHASLRKTKKDFIVSIVHNHIRLQRALPLEETTREMALLEAKHLEMVVQNAPKDRFKAARYLQRHGGLPYYPQWNVDVTDKDEYIQWVAEATRKRVLKIGRRW